jgi:hypothetical protein
MQDASSWECQKNKALLQLVHQNEELTRLLNEVNISLIEWASTSKKSM